MTKPAAAATRLKRRNYGQNHGYTIDGQYAPGVTTVLGAGLALPIAIPREWSARLVAEFVADNTDWLIKAPNRQFIIDGLRAIPRNNTTDAAMKGTTIHQYGEQLHDGHPVALDAAHEQWMPHVEGVARFLDEWAIDVKASEIPLALTALNVAGTTDIIAESAPIVAAVNRMRREADMPELEDGALGILDYKTGNALRDKDKVQVETYRRADLAHIAGVEQPMPPMEWAGLVHVTADGCNLELVDPRYHDPLFRLFRAALYEWEALDDKRGWIKNASRPADLSTILESSTAA